MVHTHAGFCVSGREQKSDAKLEGAGYLSSDSCSLQETLVGVRILTALSKSGFTSLNEECSRVKSWGQR